jgi:hypothetical protein
MANRRYPYYPAWDGKVEQPITARCVDLCTKRYKITNLGTYVNRPMRDKPDLSTHATGYAMDLGHSDIKVLEAIWTFFVTNSLALRVSEVHFYKMPGTKFGAGYRSSRGEGMAGVVKYKTSEESAGVGGMWIHLELEKQDPDAFEAEFRRLKPA